MTLLDWVERMCKDLELYECPRYLLESSSEWVAVSRLPTKQDLIARPEGTAFFAKENIARLRRCWVIHAKVTPEDWATRRVRPSVMTDDPDPHDIKHRDAAILDVTRKLQFEIRRVPRLWRKTEDSIARALSKPCDWMWQGAVEVKRPNPARL